MLQLVVGQEDFWDRKIEIHSCLTCSCPAEFSCPACPLLLASLNLLEIATRWPQPGYVEPTDVVKAQELAAEFEAVHWESGWSSDFAFRSSKPTQAYRSVVVGQEDLWDRKIEIR